MIYYSIDLLRRCPTRMMRYGHAILDRREGAAGFDATNQGEDHANCWKFCAMNMSRATWRRRQGRRVDSRVQIRVGVAWNARRTQEQVAKVRSRQCAHDEMRGRPSRDTIQENDR